MKKIVVILMILFAGNVMAQPAGLSGAGTAADPYLVSSMADLQALATFYNASVRNITNDYYHFLQTQNITLTGNWIPIGGIDISTVSNQTETNANPAGGKRFFGVYDGAGYLIDGLTISQSGYNNIGLFGRVGAGTIDRPVIIRNVHLRSVGSITGNSGTGSLVGRVTGSQYTLIEHCSGTGTGPVSGTRVTGGLVGANNSQQETPGGNDNPIVKMCYANIPVLGRGSDLGVGSPGHKEKIGGLVGCNQKGNTIDSYARGSVTIIDKEAQRVGGLAGCTDQRGLIDRSYSTGLVTPYPSGYSTLIGGLVGARSGQGANIGVVNSSYWDTQTSGITTSAGGTGKNTSEMKTQSTFVSWDFANTWLIAAGVNDGYPSLSLTITSYPTDGNTSWKEIATDTNWNNSANWTHGIPISSTAVVIPTSNFYPVLSDNAIIASLIINSGASLTIGPNAAMRVSGTITNDAGQAGLLIQSSATGTGSLLHNTNSVPATIERFTPGSPSVGSKYYHLVSVPLTSAAEPKSGVFLGSHLYEFDVVNQAWNHLGSSTETALAVNKGYMTYYPVNETKTYTFAGPMNNGDITIPLAYHASSSYSGFNLVPNPYPSALDWTATGTAWTKSNLADAIYIWNSGWGTPYGEGYTGNYASYVGGVGSNGGSNFIAVGQAFFVRALSSSPEPGLTITNNARVHSDQPFLKRAAAADQEVLRIKAFANNYRDEFVWRFHEAASMDYDSRYDAVKMYGLDEAPQIYGFAPDEHKLSIYSHPYNTGKISIPLGFELGLDGAVTLMFEGLHNFDAYSMYLEDLKEGKMLDLHHLDSYAFAHQEGADPRRFILHINKETHTGLKPGQQEAKTPHQIFTVGRQLHIYIPSLDGHDAVVEIIDLLGRRHQQDRLILGSGTVLDASNIEGVAIVRVIAGQQVFTQRVIIH